MPEQSDSKHRKGSGRSLAIDEVIRRYEGEWVLWQVTAFDARYMPARGKVLFHSPDRAEVTNAVRPARDQPRPIHIFLAEPRLPFDREEYVRDMEEFAARLNALLKTAHSGTA